MPGPPNRMRIHVALPKVTVNPVGPGNPETFLDVAKFAEVLRERIASRLTSAGFAVQDGASPSEEAVRLETATVVNETSTGGFATIQYTSESTSSIVQAAKRLVTVSASVPPYDGIDVRDKTGAKHAEYVAAELVNAYAGSPRMAVLLGVPPAEQAHEESPLPPHVSRPAVLPDRGASDRNDGPSMAGATQANAFAFVVGIETYRDVPAAVGAAHDAKAFSSVATRSLGIPEQNVIVALNDRASKSDIEKHLNWLRANVRKNDRIFFFFSGHGAPEPSTGTSYLLPYDGDPSALEQTALPLRTILERLNQTSAREVLAIVDSCFSGAGGRSVLPAGARPLVRVNQEKPTGKLALFTAASGSQISGPAHGEASGLFSRYVVSALATGQADMDGDGSITLSELAAWVTPRVEREARRDSREQTPTLQLGSTLKDASDFVVTTPLQRP